MKKSLKILLSLIVVITILTFSGNSYAEENGQNTGEEAVETVNNNQQENSENKVEAQVDGDAEQQANDEKESENMPETSEEKSSENVDKKEQNEGENNTPAILNTKEGGDADPAGEENEPEDTSDEPINTDIVNLLFYNDENKTDFLTGSEIVFYTGPDVSGSDTTLNDWYTIVTVPKKYLDLDYNNRAGIKVSSAESLIGNPIVTSDSENFYLRFNYASLKGGTRVEIPFIFKTKNKTTPDGTTFTITSKLYSSTDTEIKSEEKTIKNLSSVVYSTKDKSFYFTESKYREGNFTHTSSNLDELDSMYTYGEYRNDSNTTATSLGIFQPKNIRVTVKLKDGVVFDKDNPSNAAWTYDEETRTATRDYRPSDTYNYVATSYVYVKMPNFEYGKYHDAYDFTVVGLDDDGNEMESSRSNQSVVKIRIEKRKPLSYVRGINQSKSGALNYYYIDANKDKITEWTLRSAASLYYSNIEAGADPNALEYPPVYLYQVNDYDLNNHLYYYSVTIDSKSVLADMTVLNNNIVYAKTNSGQKVELARNIQLDEEFIIPEDNHLDYDNVYREIFVEFPERIELNRNENVQIKIKTKVFEQDWENAQTEGPWFLNINTGLIDVSLINRSRSYYATTRNTSDINGLNLTIAYGYSSYKINAGGNTYIQSSVDNATRLINEIAKVKIPTYATNRSLGNNQFQDLENGKLVVFIPNGWEYVNEGNNKTQVTYYKHTGDPNSAAYRSTTIDYNPVLEYDYMGTGKRALIFNIDDLPDRNKVQNYIMAPTINLKAISSTPEGSSDVEAYLSFTNIGKYKYTPYLNYSAYKYKADQYDLNGNGNTEEYLPYTSQEIKYVPPREVVGIKKAGKTLESLVPIATSIMDLGDEFYYSFEIKNLQRDVSVRSFEIIDILPYVNDKVIVANTDGAYSGRFSQYETKLIGPIKLLKDGVLVESEDFTISYSTDAPVSGDTDANLNKTFISEVDDWTQEDFEKVTMFKIRMNDGVMIDSKGSVEFAVLTKIPDDKENIKDGMVSHNTFAFAPSNIAGSSFTATSFLEVNKVTVPVARYVINGTVYRDFNYSGVFNTEEKGIEGIKVGLFDEEDNLVEEQVTDANGWYEFDVLKRGKYRIKIIEKPDYLTFYDENEIPSDIFPLSDISDDKSLVNTLEVHNDVDTQGLGVIVEVNPNDKKKVVNAALVDGLTEKEVEKVWVGNEPTVESIVVKLFGNNQEMEMEILADEEWKATFINLREYDKDFNLISYSLEELSVEGWEVTTISETENGYRITNTYEVIVEEPEPTPTPEPSPTPSPEVPEDNLSPKTPETKENPVVNCYYAVPNTGNTQIMGGYLVLMVMALFGLLFIQIKKH